MKFRPEITRVKLNPEQAVLSCGCYCMGYRKWIPFNTPRWTYMGGLGFSICRLPGQPERSCFHQAPVVIENELSSS